MLISKMLPFHICVYIATFWLFTILHMLDDLQHRVNDDENKKVMTNGTDALRYSLDAPLISRDEWERIIGCTSENENELNMPQHTTDSVRNI